MDTEQDTMKRIQSSLAAIEEAIYEVEELLKALVNLAHGTQRMVGIVRAGQLAQRALSHLEADSED